MLGAGCEAGDLHRVRHPVLLAGDRVRGVGRRAARQHIVG